jgi:predicted phosphodiesterase
VFGVDIDAVQLTWSRLDADLARVRIGDVVVDLDRADLDRAGADRAIWGGVDPVTRGPGSVVVGGLPPGSLAEARFESVRGAPRGQRPVRTLNPPPGRELFRFATIGDLHLGEDRFGYFGTITEPGHPPEPYSVRAAAAAIDELRHWGAELLLVKGDITLDARAHDWETFGRLVEAAGVPVMATAGNHDQVLHVSEPPWGRLVGQVARHLGPPIPPDEGRAVAGLPPAGGVQVRDVPGLRIVLVDTSMPGQRRGQVATHLDELADAVGSAPGPAFIALHHQLMTTPVPTYIPMGLDRDQSVALLDRVVAANPAVLVTSGHTHRHRRRDHGPAVVTEVGSPKDYPGTWAGYVVHEGGIRQVVRRIGRPDVMRWTDRSADAAFGLWGRWSPGTLADRCFTHTWPTR